MYIYKITNIINNKVYIGQHNGKRKTYFGGGVLLKKAIKKYGKENFKKEIIVDNIDNQNLLDELEKHYIHLYNCTLKDFGYNLQKGGRGYKKPPTFNEESLLKLKSRMKGNKIMLGKKRDLDSIKKQSETWKYLQSLKSKEEKTKTALKASVKRKLKIKEIGEKISKSKKGKCVGWENNQSHPVLQFSLKGEPLKLWSSAYQAQVEKGFLSSHIRNCCIGKSKTYKKYLWKYASEEDIKLYSNLKDAVIEKPYKSGKNKKVYVKNLNGDIVYTFENSRKVADFFKLRFPTVSAIISKNKIYKKQYIFTFY